MSLQYLTNSDLKNARLVSKQWSGCASEFLFTKLFVSPHSLNLEGFVTIARDSRLSKCVKELEYDAVHFSPYITISQYFEILWRQTGTITSAKEFGLKKFDPEIHCYVAFLNDLEKNPNKSDEIMTKAWAECRRFAFVQWGYWKWMEEARFEKGCTEQKSYQKALISGLKNLTRLRTVKLRGKWPSSAKFGGQGSRLARTWNPLHAQPGGLIVGAGLKVVKPAEDFRDLTFALSEARVTGVRNLFIECAIPPPTAFRHGLDQKRGFMAAWMSVYARLENLKLSVPESCADPLVDEYVNVHKVRRMLGSLTTLKRLELELPDDHVNDTVCYYPYEMVFPKNGHWPELTAFTVRHLAISTKDLVTLFIKKMPNLRHLAFGSIHLRDGTWKGIVEYLRILHRLSSFSIAPDSVLLDSYDHRFLSCYMDNIHSVMDYVVDRQDDRSLKHPSLLPDEPAHCSLEYMQDVSRLCGYHENDGIQEALDKLIQDETTRYSTQ